MVWHLWSFTFLSVTNFLDSLSRAVGALSYADLVKEQDYLVFSKALTKKWIYKLLH